MVPSLFINIVFTMLFLPFNYFNSFNNQFPEVIELRSNTSNKNLVKSKKSQRGDGFYVIVRKAYFYTQPNHNYITAKRYLVRGDYCEVLRYKNNFGYVNYYNYNNSKTTSGWLDLDDLGSY